MVVLATMAAIIASQALISGAFSLTNQAVQLGYLPRVTVVHTSHKTEGQIYIPEVNWLLMVACVALVLAFKSSSSLAAAYGIAVTGTMAITSFLYFLVCRAQLELSLAHALALFIPFSSIDLAFFSANVVKIARRRLVPARGRRRRVHDHDDVVARPHRALEDDGDRHDPRRAVPRPTSPTTPLPRVAGTAVFMSSGTDGMPNVLLHHVKHNKVLHQQVVLLSVVTENVPFVDRQLGARGARARPRLLPRASRASASCSSRTCRRSSRAARSKASIVNERRHDVLPRPPDAADHGQVADRALAQDAVLVPRAQLAPADRVLQPAAEPRRRAGLQIEL